MSTQPKFAAADVLACAGTSLVSRAIALGTCKWHQLFRGEWFSHVAMVAPYFGDRTGSLKVWESTTLSPIPCDVRDRLVSGVQCHGPERWLHTYPGKVWRLRMRPETALSDEQAKHLGIYLAEYLGRAYDTESAVLAGTHWTKRLFWNPPDQTSFFCDELVAQALMDIRVVARTFNPQQITPAWLCWFLVDIGLYRPWERIK